MFKHLLTQPTGDPNVEIDDNLGGNYDRLFMADYCATQCGRRPKLAT